MPPLKCCKKTWSVGSDDFVLSSVVGIIFHTVWLGGLIAFTLVVLVGRDCFPEGPRKKTVFAFIFSQIALQALVIISEGFVGFISSRGTIRNSKPRRLLPHFLRLRAILYAVEILGCVFGCYVAWSSYIQDHINCERANRVRQALQAYVISVIVVLVMIAVLFMVYFDPLGLQTPSLLKELVYRKSTDEIDSDGDGKGDDIVVDVMKVEYKKNGDKVLKKQDTKRLYSASSQQRWRRRVKVLCCCAGSNNGSKTQAMEDMVHAMATMFDGDESDEMVPTDFMAALMLVHQDQKAQTKKGCDLGAQLKNITYKSMEKNQFPNQFPPKYKKDASECTIHFDLPNIRLLQDIRHYLKFALGMYGWPVQVYMSPLVGSVCLCANLRCRALHNRAKDFVHDNCCLANTAAFQLQTELTNNDVICTSYKNEVHFPPYSLSYDHDRKAVVLSIRGSMSLRDALTDMNISMEDVKVDDEEYKDCMTKVHAGMLKAAKNIQKEIDERLKKALRSQGHDYRFIITGHSLGAGVAAILAVLYRKEFHNLHCYAFSPPGSLFTLPLVEYSKSFITTIIYRNDIVPRLTFRSLLYLKRNMTHLKNHSKIPKHAILCPSLFSCCYQQHNVPKLEDADIYDHSTKTGTLVDETDGLPLQQHTPRQNKIHMADITRSAQVTSKCSKIWLKKSSLHQLVEKIHTVEQAPAFVPGRVLYIRETEKRIHRRFWNVIGEKEVYAVWMPNAEFSYIIVNLGILDDHLPDTIQEVIDRLYQQVLSGRKVEDPIQLDTKSDGDKKENGQPIHSNAVSKQNGTYNTNGKKDTITAAHMSTTEVIVHALSEGENGLLTAQEDLSMTSL